MLGYVPVIRKRCTQCSVARIRPRIPTRRPPSDPPVNGGRSPSPLTGRVGEGPSSVGQASETVSKFVADRESWYGTWVYPPGWPGRYTSGSRSDKRQESIISYKHRTLLRRLRTSCAPAYARAPGGSSLRATQCGTIATASGILRQFHLACP